MFDNRSVFYDWSRNVMSRQRNWEMILTFQEPSNMYKTEVYQGLTLEQINDAVEKKFEENNIIGMTMRSIPVDSVALQSHNKYLNGKGL